MSFFAPPPPPPHTKNSENQNLKKMKNNCWRYHHFTHVYQKPQSCEVRFLRYGVRQTIFVISDHFLPFYPLTTYKIKILKNKKKHLEMSSFYKCVAKITIIWQMLPEIWSARDIIFCHLGHFLPFYPNNEPEK